MNAAPDPVWLTICLIVFHETVGRFCPAYSSQSANKYVHSSDRRNWTGKNCIPGSCINSSQPQAQTQRYLMESSSAPIQKKRQLTSLTGLRFLAALHVLLFHAYGGLSNASVFQLLHPLENWFLSGYVGVKKEDV